jgi:hypothetical protein
VVAIRLIPALQTIISFPLDLAKIRFQNFWISQLQDALSGT